MKLPKKIWDKVLLNPFKEVEIPENKDKNIIKHSSMLRLPKGIYNTWHFVSLKLKPGSIQAPFCLLHPKYH